MSAGGPTQVFTIESPVLDVGDVVGDDAEESEALFDVAELLELEHDASTSDAKTDAQTARAMTTTVGNWC